MASDDQFLMYFPEPEPEPVPDRLTDSQDLAIVRIFLNAAIACIAHTRELIPWRSRCFHVRNIDQLRPSIDNDVQYYNSFCTLLSSGDQKTQEFRILGRGADKRADMILDTLENGVSDSVRSGYLHAMRILVTTETDDPTGLLESYTFNFRYSNDKVSHIKVSSQRGRIFSISEIRKSFASAIRALLRSMRHMPRLPRRRRLGISLLYNQTCPTSYQPAGFVDLNAQRTSQDRIPWKDLWTEETDFFTAFQTGKHNVSIGAKTLTYASSLSWSQMQDVSVSGHLQRMHMTSSRNPDLVSTMSEPFVTQSTNQTTKVAAAPVLRQRNDLTGPQRGRETIATADADTTMTAGDLLEGAGDQNSVALQQYPPILGNSLSTLTVRAKHRRRRNVEVSKLAELVVQARAVENDNASGTPIFHPAQLKLGKILRIAQVAEVGCECGSSHESDAMLFCELCGTWQHKKCYGYVGLRPNGLPEEHFCYSCLLLPRESHVNQNMPALVRMRLALLHLSQSVSSTVLIDDVFANAVCPGQSALSRTFLTLLNRLSDEGYLSTSRDKDVVEIIARVEEIEEAQKAYLDPLAGIAQHYDVVRDGARSGIRDIQILRAIKGYHGNRHVSMADPTNSHLDRVHVRDSKGNVVVRWGFYTHWRRRGDTRVEAQRRKASITSDFIGIDRSSSSEGMPLGDMMAEAVGEAEWDMRLASRNSPIGQDFS